MPLDGAAPLVSIPEAPAPDGATAEWFDGADGVRLRAVLVPGGTRGTLVVSPGRTEPLEKYWEVAGELAARGFTVLLHDWRGQGLSARACRDPLSGHADGWRPFVSDFSRLLDQFGGRLPQPWLAMGHSMGGGLTALALSEGEDRFAGAVLSAPMAGVNLGALKPAVARAICAAMGGLGQAKVLVRKGGDPLEDAFEGNVLTHDRTRWERSRAQLLACPEMRLGGVTWGWVRFALMLQARLERPGAAERIGIPFTVVTAEQEKLVLSASAQRLAQRAPRGRHGQVEGALHEILMETDARRAVFWAEFDRLADAVAPRRGSRAA